MAVADYNTVQEFCNTLHDHVKKSTHYHMMTDYLHKKGFPHSKTHLPGILWR